MPVGSSECRRHMASIICMVAVAVHVCLQASSSSSSTEEGRRPWAGAPPAVSNTSHHSSGGTVPFSVLQMRRLREEAADMFRFSFDNYRTHAFPKDDLRPVSCGGSNSQGGIALTLLDSLDSLLLLNNVTALRHAVHWLAVNPSLFDVDARVHVFEVTIRAMGGLLSTHMLLQQDHMLVPGYNGTLLAAAVDLANRLLPAFDTATGIPLSWVNLRRGQVRGDTRVTCTACAGTLVLEFGVLSRLTGDPIYEEKAKHAVTVIWGMRSGRHLLGNTVHVDSGRWVRHDSSIGPGVDSFYEYLLKAYLLFGDRSYLDMFAPAYAAAMAHMALSPPLNGAAWLLDVHMSSGRVLHPYVSSLAAFWPGLQAMIGQEEEAVQALAGWMAAWKHFNYLPEMFHWTLDHAHPTQAAYPLRPELAESIFFLYAATGHASLLREAAAMLTRVKDGTRVRCGHATVGDVATGRLEDSMESFFLSETAKYFYLLFANATGVVDHFVMSTEAHPFPPFLDDARMRQSTCKLAEAAAASGTGSCTTLCGAANLPQGAASAAMLRAALPHLPLQAQAPALLRQRRCAACQAVRGELAAARRQADKLWRGSHRGRQRGALAAPPQWLTPVTGTSHDPLLHLRRLFLCVLSPLQSKKLGCTLVKEVPPTSLTSQAVQALAANVVFFQLAPPLRGGMDQGQPGSSASAQVLADSLVAVDVVGSGEQGGSPRGAAHEHHSQTVPAMLADFGPDLLPGCNCSDPVAAAAARREWAEVQADRDALAEVDAEESENEHEESQEDILQRIAQLERQAAAMEVEFAQERQQWGAREDEDEYEDPDDMGLDPASGEAERTSVSMPHPHVTAAGDGGRDMPPLCEVTGRLVAANPPDACRALSNAADIAGAVALVTRGACSFMSKATAVESAGGTAVVVINDKAANFVNDDGQEDAGLMMMMGAEDPGARRHPRIPAVMVQQVDGARLAQLVKAAFTASVRVYSPPVAVRRRMAHDMLAAKQSAAAAGGGRGTDDRRGDGKAENTGSPDEDLPQLELIAPLNAQAWLVHQLYARHMDITPALHHVVAKLTGHNLSERQQHEKSLL